MTQLAPHALVLLAVLIALLTAVLCLREPAQPSIAAEQRRRREANAARAQAELWSAWVKPE